MGTEVEKELFAVCMVILDEQGRILTVARKHNPNDINLPGGKIDFGETPREAAAREVYEETGLNLGGGQIEEIFRQVDPDDNLCATFLYREVINSDRIEDGPRDGEGYVRWCHINQICDDSSTYKLYNIELRDMLVKMGVIR